MFRFIQGLTTFFAVLYFIGSIADKDLKSKEHLGYLCFAMTLLLLMSEILVRMV